MANPEHLEVLKQGHKVWNEWRWKNSVWAPDLSSAHLHLADLGFIDLREANLRDANLRSAILCHAYLQSADLRGANLFRANLYCAHLGYADFTNADLREANLFAADLRGTKVCGADFTSAAVGWTVFADLDLSEVKGLRSIWHRSPCSIGVDTIYRSKGKIPDVFLRSAGVPEEFIKYAQSLVGRTEEFHSCFISFSTWDGEFSKRLYADLQQNVVPCWYFPENAKSGEPVWGEIDRGIGTYDKLIVICSESSLQSPAVLREIERALQREDRERKNILFPIRIDNYVFDKWEHERKADVIKKVVGDFTHWKEHDPYQKALYKLLRDLKASETK